MRKKAAEFKSEMQSPAYATGHYRVLSLYSIVAGGVGRTLHL